jgi:uncharacterized protein (TIGR02099 family)
MSLLLRLLAGLLRWGLVAFAVLLVLAAFYVSLGRELVPLVAEYRDELQDRAEEALRVPLSIGRLEGHWRGFAPELVARDVVVGAPGQEMRLDRVRVRPDLLGSLLNWQPRLAGLTVSGLQLIVRQDSEGRWRVQGLPQQESTGVLDPEPLLRELRRFPQVTVIDSQVVLHPQGEQPLSLNYLNLSLTDSGGGRKRLDGRVLLPDGQPLTWQLKSRLQPATWRDAQLDLYLRLPQSDWSRWLPRAFTAQWHAQQVRAGGEIWLNWAERDLQHAVVRWHAPSVVAGYAEHPALHLEDLSFNLYLQRTEQGRRLLVDSLAATLDGTRWGPAKLVIDQQAQVLQMSADRLDLAPLVQGVRALAPLPEALSVALEALQPRGRLHNLQVTYQPGAEPHARWHYAANLADVAFDPYHGAPGAEQVSGSVEGDLREGELRLNSDGFALHLDQLFSEPWRYRQAQARLNWRFDDEALSLWSPYLRVVGEEGRLAGDFLIRLQRDPEAEDYMDLRIGLSDGNARYAGKYLPSRSPAISPALTTWLQTAIRAGSIEQGFFQYQGSLNKGAEAAARTLSLYFKVRDAELAYQPGWPVLQQARGEVFVEDSGVTVAISDGRLLGSRVLEALARVPPAEPGQSAHLLLDAHLQSSVEDGLKILQEGPLPTAETFAGWSGGGAVDAQLHLDIALGEGPAPYVRVDFAPQGARLTLPQPELELSDVKGAFRFDTKTGLSASSVRGQALGQPLSGTISSEGPERILVDVQGQVPVKTLSDWLRVDRPLPVSGRLPYRLRLQLAGDNSQLRVDSSLQGVAIDLPAPFGKTAGESRYADWRMSLGSQERQYWLDYADASLAAALPDNDLQRLRGELRLGLGPARLTQESGFVLRGQLAELDVSAWQAVRERYLGGATEQGGSPPLYVELYVERFIGFGQELQDLMLRLKRDGAAWRAELDSRRIAGSIHLPDSPQLPIRVNLQYVRLLAGGGEVEQRDPLADIDPRTLPAVDLSIGQVMLGDSPLGAWAFKARPQSNGLRLQELDLNLKGLKIGGDAGWEMAAGAPRTWYKGRLQGEDLGRVLLAWGFAPTASSERFRLDADAHWPGSPAAFNVNTLSGNLSADVRKGQFSEVQGSASALRVFGLLNFNAIGRRLRLDFSDLFGRGLSYDRVKGTIAVRKGVYTNVEPLTMTGPSASLEFTGTLDMPRDRVDGTLLVALPLTNNLPLAALIAGAPAIGGALFLIDKLLGDHVARFAGVEYEVSGSVQSPQITYGKPVDRKTGTP